MGIRLKYYREDDILDVITGVAEEETCTLLDHSGVIVDLAGDDCRAIVGITILGAGPCISLTQGYDAETDTSLLGDTTSDPAMVSENGDLVGYWQVDELDPEGPGDLVGVAIKQASKHFAGITELVG